MSSYAHKAVKNTRSETSSYQGTSTITLNMTPVALADPHSLPSHLEHSPLPLSTLFILQRPEQVLPPAENLSLPLTPDSLGTGPFITQTEAELLETRNPVVRPFLYLHSPGPRSPTSYLLIVDESPTERSPL